MASSRARKILIAMDGSTHAEYALRYFKENLHDEKDDVIVVYAAETGHLTSQPVFSTDPQMMAHMAMEGERELDKLLEKITKLMTDMGVKGRVERVTANGGPGEAVVKAATDLHADMIVTGSRGQGKLRRTLLGSVSQYIVHHAHVPVLVCCAEK
ncbi:universal stress protein in QAH/OAS sulfhydrylase 3'region-like [Babylonia areolata]|uniref:universal stress protein in QAH/OAS sulfhydrylase 3'region-like n=1 Tax=Babylonia areolata TaxID=304850 RepID=UPI003FD50AE0